MDKWLSVNESAEKIGVSPRTIRRYIKKGELEHQSVRGRRRQEYRISTDSLDELCKRQKIGKISGRTGAGKTVPKYLYDEIREENKKLVVNINELKKQLNELQEAKTSTKVHDEIVAELKQELLEKEDLIQLLETRIAALKKF